MLNTDLKPHWFDPRHWPLAIRLALAMIFLIALTLGGATLFITQRAQTRLTQEIGQTFEAQAESANHLIELFLYHKVAELQALILSDMITNALIRRNAAYQGSLTQIQAEIQSLENVWATPTADNRLITHLISNDARINPVSARLYRFQQIFEEHSQLLVTDRYGATIGATQRWPAYAHVHQIWWQRGWNNGRGALYVSDPIFEARAGTFILWIAVPIYTPNNDEAIGVLHSTLVLEELSELLAHQSFGQTGHVDVLDREGKLILAAPAANRMEAEDYHNLRLRVTERASGFALDNADHAELQLIGYAAFNKDDFEFEVTTPAERQIIEAVLKLNWVTVVEQEATEAFAGVHQIWWDNLLVGGLAIVVAGLTAPLLAQTITRRLRLLTQAAEELSAGRLDTPLPPPRGDEVGKLTRNFGRMAARLNHTLTVLEQQVAERTAELLNTNRELQKEIAERRRIQEALLLAFDQAQAADRLKSEILSNLSHELRTPLGVSLGYADMMKEDVFGPTSPQQREALETISRGNREVLKLFNSLLDEAKLESGKLTLKYRAFAPAQMVEPVLTKLGGLAQAKRLALTSSIGADLPATLWGDLARLQQILTELVSNAIKFSEAGGVEICLDRVGPKLWAVEVTDTGPGIPAEMQTYIFEPFRQGDGSLTRRHGGTGLGLSIAKQLTELMEGELSLESEIGQGSTFTILLPLREPASE